MKHIHTISLQSSACIRPVLTFFSSVWSELLPNSNPPISEHTSLLGETHQAPVPRLRGSIVATILSIIERIKECLFSTHVFKCLFFNVLFLSFFFLLLFGAVPWKQILTENQWINGFLSLLNWKLLSNCFHLQREIFFLLNPPPPNTRSSTPKTPHYWIKNL